MQAFAGVRVLPTAAGAASGRARDTRLHITHAGRVLSISGGKLTTYRAMSGWGIKQGARAVVVRATRADTAVPPLRE